MKYFIDTEFKEYFKQHKLLGIPVGYPTPTIDLISIGIVCEDGSTFYELNKECDLKEIWKDEWLQMNVLVPIYKNHVNGDMRNHISFSYSTMKGIFKGFGKTRQQLAEHILHFCSAGYFDNTNLQYDEAKEYKLYGEFIPEFYGYYADYDWVVFCQLFGRMMNLPEGFPMYCKDLKQMMDDKGLTKEWKQENCPDPENEHNALADAKWNMKLYNTINT